MKLKIKLALVMMKAINTVIPKDKKKVLFYLKPDFSDIWKGVI